MGITRTLFTRKFMLQILAMIVITIAVLGVCAECSGEGGMSQEGGDSEPYWR